MFVVLGNGHPGEGVSWWGTFADADAADEFIEAAWVLDCLRVELIDPEGIRELLDVSPLPARRFREAAPMAVLHRYPRLVTACKSRVRWGSAIP
jgi:hypothetical protein